MGSCIAAAKSDERWELLKPKKAIVTQIRGFRGLRRVDRNRTRNETVGRHVATAAPAQSCLISGGEFTADVLDARIDQALTSGDGHNSLNLRMYSVTTNKLDQRIKARTSLTPECLTTQISVPLAHLSVERCKQQGGALSFEGDVLSISASGRLHEKRRCVTVSYAFCGQETVAMLLDNVK